ncbi:MAG: UDP-N-acetylglucosamine 2-epimerase [Candidatus Rokuibacteriota bacterium]
MREIAAILVDRANYGRMKPVLRALCARTGLRTRVVCTGTMLLDRFGMAMHNVEEDGFPIDGKVYLELEGSTPVTMAKSLGLAVMELTSELARLRPDIVLVIGDRYEALAATLAAAYLNICIAHIQGGEVSGSIDESARHAMTKLAHYHFPATRRAADYLIRMGERPETVFRVGCPSGDLALKEDLWLTPEILNSHGVGAILDPRRPFLTVVFHPVTTQFGSEVDQVKALYDAVAGLGMQTCWLWPNIDAGSDNVSKFLRAQRERNHHASDRWLRAVKHFQPIDFLKVIAGSACLVGNSSSFVRDASFVGTPVVLVGNRQDGRETAEHVIRVPPAENAILDGIQGQLAHGRYPGSRLYGGGDAAEQIAARLAHVPIYHQKRLAYAPDLRDQPAERGPAAPAPLGTDTLVAFEL